MAVSCLLMALAVVIIFGIDANATNPGLPESAVQAASRNLDQGLVSQESTATPIKQAKVPAVAVPRGIDQGNKFLAVAAASSGGGPVYDPMRRIVKIVETRAGSVTSTKQFVWAGDQLCEERDASGNVTKRFFNQGEQIGGTNYYYTRDHLGSVREMTDGSGNTVAAYSYDPYGRATKTQGSLDSDMQYAGMYMHQPSGLNLAVNRVYTAPALFPNSASGRFRHLHPPYAKNHINVVAIDFYPLHESSNHVPLRFEIERLQICQYV